MLFPVQLLHSILSIKDQWPCTLSLTQAPFVSKGARCSIYFDLIVFFWSECNDGNKGQEKNKSIRSENPNIWPPPVKCRLQTQTGRGSDGTFCLIRVRIKQMETESRCRLVEGEKTWERWETTKRQSRKGRWCQTQARTRMAEAAGHSFVQLSQKSLSTLFEKQTRGGGFLNVMFLWLCGFPLFRSYRPSI